MAWDVEYTDDVWSPANGHSPHWRNEEGRWSLVWSQRSACG